MIDGEDNPSKITEFLEEGTIMANFKHENVLGLLGVMIKENRPHVILPFMDKGDLKGYVSDQNNVSMHNTCSMLHIMDKGNTCQIMEREPGISVKF